MQFTRSAKTVIFFSCCLLILAFSHPPITWVAIGDSITYLNDHPDETGNKVTKGYMTRVTEKLPYIHFINQGYNGWTSGGIADSIDHLGLVKADVYSVFLGTNDWWHARPLGKPADYREDKGNSTVYGSFRIIVNKLRNLNPAAKIILITPMQRGDFVYVGNKKNQAWGSYKDKDGQTLEQFAEAVKAIGEMEKFTVIDLYHESRLAQDQLVKFKRMKDSATGQYKDYVYPDFVGLPFNPSTDEYPYPAGSAGMTYDGLHPSDAGNAVIAQLLVKALKK